MTDAINAQSDVLGECELDAVSGGDRTLTLAQQNALEQQQINAENKKQEDALKGFQQALQELP
jgi:hypothetical protein